MVIGLSAKAICRRIQIEWELAEGALPIGVDAENKMEVHELVVEMKLLERRLTLYEEKYGILSEDFYEALTASKFERYDEYDETCNDFSRWKGIYETWQRRKRKYDAQLSERGIADSLRLRPTSSYMTNVLGFRPFSDLMRNITEF